MLRKSVVKTTLTLIISTGLLLGATGCAATLTQVDSSTKSEVKVNDDVLAVITNYKTFVNSINSIDEPTYVEIIALTQTMPADVTDEQIEDFIKLMESLAPEAFDILYTDGLSVEERGEIVFSLVQAGAQSSATGTAFSINIPVEAVTVTGDAAVLSIDDSQFKTQGKVVKLGAGGEPVNFVKKDGKWRVIVNQTVLDTLHS